jgi:hypothetical protein
MINKDLNKLIRMVGIFKMDRAQWPSSAAELIRFVERKGWTVDISTFHTLTFKTLSPGKVAVEMAWPAPGNWLSCLKVEVEEISVLGQDNLHFAEHHQPQPPRKRETRSFCFIEKTQTVRRKSA